MFNLNTWCCGSHSFPFLMPSRSPWWGVESDGPAKRCSLLSKFGYLCSPLGLSEIHQDPKPVRWPISPWYTDKPRTPPSLMAQWLFFPPVPREPHFPSFVFLSLGIHFPEESGIHLLDPHFLRWGEMRGKVKSYKIANINYFWLRGRKEGRKESRLAGKLEETRTRIL